MSDFKPFLVRLSPRNRELLDQAKEELEKSKSSIINDAIKAYLATDKKDIHSRLNRLV
tara:strand:- start:145 stop:318 length:174 start_codon:yes stop_codon:yes gene_type:complete